jgi:hypothetical protein
MPFKTLPLRAGDAFLRLLLYPALFFRGQGASHSRDTHHGLYRMPSLSVDSLDHSLSLLPEVDLSPMNDPSTPSEDLVDAVHNLKPFLPSGCEIMGQGDLKIAGSGPINAGGFADIWVGKRDDGTKVAIKSYRHYSSSSSLPIYLVSVEHDRNAFCLLMAPGRGYTGKC